MALTRTHVSVRLEELFCHQQSAFGDILNPASEPYLWPIFFSIDGNGVSITDPPEFLLTGNVTVLATQGGHGNLGDDGNVTDGELVPIPPGVGNLDYIASAMSLPFPCDPLKPEGVQGIVGVIVILNEQGSVQDDAVLVGYETLQNAVRLALDDLINGRSIFAGDPSQTELDAIQSSVADTVERAIRDQLGILPIFAALNPDNPIGSAVFLFSLEELLGDGEAILNARLVLDEPAHDWEIRGRITAAVVETCPFNTANRALLAAGEPEIELGDFRAFRDRTLPTRKNLGRWAELVSDHSATVMRTLLADAGARQLARRTAASARKLLASPESVLSDELVAQVIELLDAGIVRGTPQAKRDFGLVRRTADRLRGKTVKEAVDLLSTIPPRGKATLRPKIDVPAK